jgi:hypothetical protein
VAAGVDVVVAVSLTRQGVQAVRVGGIGVEVGLGLGLRVEVVAVLVVGLSEGRRAATRASTKAVTNSRLQNAQCAFGVSVTAERPGRGKVE